MHAEIQIKSCQFNVTLPLLGIVYVTSGAGAGPLPLGLTTYRPSSIPVTTIFPLL